MHRIITQIQTSINHQLVHGPNRTTNHPLPYNIATRPNNPAANAPTPTTGTAAAPVNCGGIAEVALGAV